MSSKAQRNGMHGVFLVAAQLASRGLIVSTTSRNAMGADLLVTDDSCVHPYSIQVKTNAKPANFWLVGKKTRKLVSPSHVYVLVNLRNEGKDKGKHDYYVVPSREVARKTKGSPRFRSVYRDEVKRFKDAWRHLGVE